MVDREYRVMEALAETDVPVPRVHCLCQDEDVIGTSFYVMEYVEGRVIRRPDLPDESPEERSAIYDSMNDVLGPRPRTWRTWKIWPTGCRRTSQGTIP
jgi:aminoglycoside phosphotransferase (APT) family kinase protein